MVGHKSIGVERALLLLQGFAQPVEVSLVVFLTKEAEFTIVSALDNVQGYAIKVNTGAAGHQ
jgi:hypothetical protein